MLPRSPLLPALFCLAVALALAMGLSAPPARAEVAESPIKSPITLLLRIDLRAEIAAGRFDPRQQNVGVRGSHPPLAWGHSWPATRAADEGIYTARVPFATLPRTGQPLAYKAKLEGGGFSANEGWEEGPNHRVRLLAGGVSTVVARAFNATPVLLPPQRTGRIDRIARIDRLDPLDLHIKPSNHPLAQGREVQVWLPPGYGTDPLRRHPVLLLHDGQNMFDDSAAGAEWQMDEAAQALVLAGEVTPPILVAVASTASRTQDYTPDNGAPAYARWLVDELLPFIERRYATLATREGRAVGGSSLAGLLSMWLVLAEPQAFGAALVVSPSVWWNGRAILHDAAGNAGGPPSVAPWPAGLPPPRLWLDMGAAEGRRHVDNARALRDALQQRGWPVQYSEDADGGHDEASWAARASAMLRFLYARQQPTTLGKAPGLEGSRSAPK